MTRRHCMVVHSYYPIGETRVQRQALALVDRGYNVDVLCLRGDGEARREVVEGVSIHRLPVRRHRADGFARQLFEYLMFFFLAGAVLSARHLRRRYQTVQVHNLPDFLVFCALVPKITGTPVLLDLHDLMPEFFASKTESTMDRGFVRLVALQERLACAFADHVITVTASWQHTLAERATDATKVSVVMNLADPRVFEPAPRDRRTNGQPWRVLYHGTFTRRYGVDLVIEAVAKVRETIPEIHVELVGDGDGRGELIELRRSRNLVDHVSISDGMIDAALLPEMIRRADVGVVPNRSDIFTDGLLPTKLLEYVAMQTPVIASRTPGVTEYFDDSMLAFFEPGDPDDLADCLRRLHHDRGRLNDLATEAAQFGVDHEWSSEAEAYVALIEKVGTDD